MFKNETRVRYLGTNPRHQGLDGTVKGITAMGSYRVLMDNGARLVVPPGKLTLVSPLRGRTASCLIVDDVCAQTATVPVYDRKNPDRLLGHFQHRPFAQLMGPRMSLAVMGRPSVSWFDDEPDAPCTAKVDRVDFNVDQRRSADGWTITVVLATDASLDLLMRLPDFRLPGESDFHAEARRYA